MSKVGLFLVTFLVCLAFSSANVHANKDLSRKYPLHKEQGNEINHGPKYHKKKGGPKKQHLLGYPGEHWALRNNGEKQGRQPDDLDDIRLQHLDFEDKPVEKKEHKMRKKKAKKQRKAHGQNKLKTEYFRNKEAQKQERQLQKTLRKSLRQEIKKALRKGISLDKIYQAYGNQQNFPQKYYQKLANKMAKSQSIP